MTKPTKKTANKPVDYDAMDSAERAYALFTACEEARKTGGHEAAKKVWNAWAESLVKERAKLIVDGNWEASSDYVEALGMLGEVGENDESIDFLRRAEINASHFIFIAKDFSGENKDEVEKKTKEVVSEFFKIIRKTIHSEALNLNEFVFPGNASFESATFTGTAYFDSATFAGAVYFVKVIFKDDVSFNSVTFTGDASFEGATFTGKADFNRAMFAGNASFGIATFTGNADFVSATLTGDADFVSATFTGEAYFGSATFTGGASFGVANFMRTAYFRSATFTGNAYFNEAIITGNAFFDSATFTGDANFVSVTITGDAHFGSATFAGNAYFMNATFTGYADFSSAIFTCDASFGSATFTDDAFFDSATFTGDLKFVQVNFNSNANLGDAKFYSGSNFAASHCERAFDLSGTKFFNQVPIFIQAHFTESPRLDHIQLPIPGYYSGRLPSPDGVKRGWKSDKDDIAAYTALRRLSLSAQDHSTERLAFKGEMRAKRSLSGFSFYRVFSYIYDALTDFGASIVRPLVVWLGLFVVVAFLYFQSAVPYQEVADFERPEICQTSSSSVSASLLSAHNALPFVTTGQRRFIDRAYICLYGNDKIITSAKALALPTNLGLWGALHTVISTVLVFFILLGLRNRFRIR